MVPSPLSLIPANNRTSEASLELLASSAVGFSIDHQAILWCKQFSTRLASAVSNNNDHRAVAQALLSGGKEQDPVLLRDRMASSESPRTWFELFVFGLRLHWPRLLPLVFAALCLAVREARRGWFFPPALRSLQRTSLVFGILPFAVLVPEFWVSLWLFLFAVAAVSLVVFAGFASSERLFARVLAKPTKRALVRWTMALGVGSALVGAVGVGLDLAFVFVYALLVWLCGFWLVVDGRGVWALCLGVVLAVELETLLLCLDSGQHSALTWQEKRAVGESLVVLAPWLVLALRVTRNKPVAVVAAAGEEPTVEEAAEEPSAPSPPPPRSAPAQTGECLVVVEPWTGGVDVLEFLTDLDYLDKATSVLVTTLSGEVVQVDDLVSQLAVEKDANAVSIVNPSKPSKPAASTAPVSAPPASPVDDLDEAPKWPKWAVWAVQLLALGCLIRPDDALPVLSPLAAALCAVLLRTHP